MFDLTRACLSHTCPDCGAITYGETNDAGELTHVCCRACREANHNPAYARHAPSHFASPRCQSGGYPHCTCDTCF